MKDTREHKSYNNLKNQNKPLVANRGFRKHDKQERPHYINRPKHFSDDYDDFDEDDNHSYSKFGNYEKINRRNETAYGGKHKGGKSIKPADVCVIANFRSATFTGRAGTEILLCGREQNLFFSGSERRSYGWIKELPLPEKANKGLELPPQAKSRCYVSPVYNFAQEHVGPQDSWVAVFDPMNEDVSQLRRLQRAGLIVVPSDKHAQACRKAGIKPQNIKIVPIPVKTKYFNAKAVCPAKYENKKGLFRIITSANPLNRKGLEDVLQAYIKEFKPEEKVELVIKLTHLPKAKKDYAYEILDFRKKLGALNSMFAKVTVIDELLPDEQYAGLLASADVFVAGNLSFNSAINVREAVACGLHVIGADYLASIANLPMNTVIPVKTNLVEIPKGELYADSPAMKVRRLDSQTLAYTMRKAFNAKDTLRGRKGGVASSFKNSMTWEELAKLVNPKPKEI